MGIPIIFGFPLLIFLSFGYHQRECMRSAALITSIKAALRIHSVGD